MNVSRIAFVNMLKMDHGYYKSFVEPVHLLGMHDICKQAGLVSGLFQMGLNGPYESIRKIVEFKPQILGLSFVGHSSEAIRDAYSLLKAFPSDLRPRLIIGGSDTQYYDYQKRFSPWLIAIGDGEKLLAELSAAGFDMNSAVSSITAKYPQSVTKQGNTFVVTNLPRIPLDEQSFQRDYSLESFDGDALAKWTRGCKGFCSFCSNVPRSVEYRSPKSAAEEIRQLDSKGAKRITIASPDFASNPTLSSGIIDEVAGSGKQLNFASRVDSMYMALNKHPRIWKKFGEYPNQIDLGAESFSADRLVRLGKYRTREKAQQQEPNLKHILDFFKGSKARVQLYTIPFDWQITLEEAENEFRYLQNLLDEYRENLLFPLRTFDNCLHHVPGSLLSEKMDELDFFNFKNDPRAMVLWLDLNCALRELNTSLEYSYGRRLQDYHINALAPYLFDFTFSRIDVLRRVPAGRFNIAPIFRAYKLLRIAGLARLVFYMQVNAGEAFKYLDVLVPPDLDIPKIFYELRNGHRIY